MKSLRLIFQKKEIILLCIIVFFGAYLRFVPIFQLSFPYTYDVGRDLLELANIVHHFDIPLIGPTTGLAGLFYGPWWYYMLVPAFIIGGGSPQGIVVFMAITGLVTIIGGYILGKNLQSTLLGLLLALFIAISPVLVSDSSQIWNPNVAPMFLILLFLVLAALIKKKELKKKFAYDRYTISLLLLVGILIGLSIDSEVIYGVFLSVSLFFYLIFFLFRIQLKAYFFTLIGLLIIFSPRIFFELRHNFIMTRTIMINLHSGNVSSTSQTTVLDQFSSAVNSLKGDWDYTFGLDNHFFGWLLLIAVLLIIFKYFKSYVYTKKQLVIYIVLTLIIYLLGLTFFSGSVWGHYTVGLPIMYVILFCVAFSSFKFKGYMRYIGIIGLILFLVISINPIKLIANYSSPLSHTDVAVYKNQVAVIDYVYTEAKGQKFSILVYTPPVKDYTYQYLFQWYGQKTYHYQPVTTGAKLLYLIIEPDPVYPDRIPAWLGEKKDMGKTIKQVTLPSGIIIQTRVL